jgi:hypothetical protein
LASAILVLYTSEGFLVAADGRMRIDGVVKSDSMTKIFHITQPGRLLFYAFGGSVGLTDKEDPEIILFDFREEVLKVIASLAAKNHPELLAYGTELSMKLCCRLLEVQADDRIEPFKKAENPGSVVLVACMFLGGYYNGQPSLVCAQLLHRDQTVLPPVVSTIAFPKGYKPSLLYGSDVVRKLLFETEDPAFAAYRVPQINAPENVTLSEAVEVARKYILACSDPAALSIDGKHCAGIGGHIHMAKVTPQSGFVWLVPPKQ